MLSLHTSHTFAPHQCAVSVCKTPTPQHFLFHIIADTSCCDIVLHITHSSRNTFVLRTYLPITACRHHNIVFVFFLIRVHVVCSHAQRTSFLLCCASTESARAGSVRLAFLNNIRTLFGNHAIARRRHLRIALMLFLNQMHAHRFCAQRNLRAVSYFPRTAKLNL